jgi:hypothetical protein
MSESSDFGEQRFEGGSVGGVDEFAAGREFTLGIEFSMRTEGDDQAVDVSRRSITTAFGNVRRDGDCGLSHLMGESKLFARGKMFGHIVDAIREIHRPLPHDEISEALDV